MKSLRKLVILALLLVSLGVSGCATTEDISTAQPTGNYWPLDSLAMSYADPVAVSPIHDHPLRWLAFAGHPAGVILDYAVNRPIYAIGSAFPTLFGYTAEDAGHQAQRSVQNYQ
jgi:hypothetical protein